MNIGDTVCNDILLMDMEVNNIIWNEINANVLFSIRTTTWDNMQCSTYFSSNDIIL